MLFPARAGVKRLQRLSLDTFFFFFPRIEASAKAHGKELALLDDGSGATYTYEERPSLHPKSIEIPKKTIETQVKSI